MTTRPIRGLHGLQQQQHRIMGRTIVTELAAAQNACPLVTALNQVDRQGLTSRNAAYASLLRSCGAQKALLDGRRIHAHLNSSGRDLNTFLANCLVQMYGKCGSVEDAWNVFNRIGHRNMFSWNFMIGIYAQNGHEAEALQLYRYMLTEGIEPNKFTYFSILSASASLRALAEGKEIHERIVASGLESDTAVRTALVNMYVRCGSLKDARTIFDVMHERNVVSWTALIAAYAKNGHCKEALKLFRQMDFEGVKPDKVAFLSTLDACARLGSLENGRAIHGRIVASALSADVSVSNALVNMYGKCGSPNEARVVFDDMHQRIVVSWTAMIAAYAQNGRGKEGLELFRKMDLEGIKPNRITFITALDACANLVSLENGRAIHERIVACGFDSDVTVRTALVNMYGKCNGLKDARAVFDKIHERDVILWNTMIAAYAQNGSGKEALKLFIQMDLEGVQPNSITFLCTLEACASLASLENGKVLHQRIVESGFDLDIAVKNALVNMYGKCRSLKDSQMVFNEMQERNTLSWIAMVAAYAQNGHGKKGIELFRQLNLDSIKPSRITFVNILEACGSLASLECGRVIHERIVASGFDSDAIVRTALMNMYGKCGRLKEARMIFDEMQEPNVISWTAIISAYVQNGYGKEGLELFRQMDLAGVKPNKITFLRTLDACANLASLENGRVMHDHIVASGLGSDVAVSNALVHMYGKCGSLKDASAVFDKMYERDIISWNAMIAAYGENGHGKQALELFKQMELQGIKPDRITFLSVLNACNLAGLLNVGWPYFVYMSRYYDITPLEKHYVCMSDLLGREGCLDEAEDLILNMPVQSSVIAWTTLLGACRIHGDVERGAHAAKRIFELDPANASTCALLSNIHAAGSR